MIKIEHVNIGEYNKDILMKKIAIQTLKVSYNYGGILQAFALQNYLEKKGCEVTHLVRLNKPPSRILRVKILLYNLLHLPFYLTTIKVNSVFKNFIKKNINSSKEFNSLGEWQNHIYKSKYDLVLVGSDQVWRLDYIRDLYPEFFLNFNSDYTKKASYAASLGVSVLDGYPLNEIRKLLSDFSGISVREDSGKLLLEKEVPQVVHHHIDPTLLLTSDDYIRKFNLNIDIRKKEIFCYVLDRGKTKKDIIDEVRNILNLDLNFANGAGVTLENFKDSDILRRPTVELWLQNFISSEFIVTDSFHGMVFSIIFNKPFIVIANIERGLSRFTSLLSKLGLEDRLIFLDKDWNRDIIRANIDYRKVNFLLDEEKNKANKYLDDILN